MIKGYEAQVTRSDPSRYQEGVFFLAYLIERCLSYAYFYQRLVSQMMTSELTGLEYEQARLSSIALHDGIVVIFHKLVDRRKDTWNFYQLYEEWCKYQNDQAVQGKIFELIANLEQTLGSLSEYRHNHIAHQSKKIEMTLLTALPSGIRHLDKIVSLMDEFVDGQIPYQLYLHESGEELDLRELLLITSA